MAFWGHFGNFLHPKKKLRWAIHRPPPQPHTLPFSSLISPRHPFLSFRLNHVHHKTVAPGCQARTCAGAPVSGLRPKRLNSPAPEDHATPRDTAAFASDSTSDNHFSGALVVPRGFIGRGETAPPHFRRWFTGKWPEEKCSWDLQLKTGISPSSIITQT